MNGCYPWVNCGATDSEALTVLVSQHPALLLFGVVLVATFLWFLRATAPYDYNSHETPHTVHITALAVLVPAMLLAGAEFLAYCWRLA